MCRAVSIVASLALTGCNGLAWNTTVADQSGVRRAMVDSIVIGQTTEVDLVTRWGRPTQKVRQGGQVEYIYRNIIDRHPLSPIQFGDSTRYVIVNFQYGLATGSRTSDTEGCRATFSPRPPGTAFYNPSVVQPIATCSELGLPLSASVPIVGEGKDGSGEPGVYDDQIFLNGKSPK